MSIDGDRAVWIATAQGATRLEFDEQSASKFRTTSVRVESGLLGREVWQVLRDRSGKLWIATANGLCLYTEGKGCRNWTMAEGLPDNYVTCLAEDQTGAIWAGMAGGVARLTDVGTPDERVVAIRGDAVFRGSNIYAIEPGGEGTIWIATDMGLFSWNGSLRSWGPRDGMPPRSINDFVADKDGSLWIATSWLRRNPVGQRDVP